MESLAGTSLPASGRKEGSGRENLVLKLAAQLRAAITGGQYQVGAKLPSEAELTAKHAVSRTVVREAIAALRSDGLVEARQGAGVFVVSNRTGPASPFHGIDIQKLSSVIEVLELRTAIEVEAAGLAAMRCSPAQEEAIFECIAEIDVCIAGDTSTTEADFALHLAIADATNNPRFRLMLDMLGQEAIPRRKLEQEERGAASREYASQLQGEHRLIAGAIADRDPARARSAMRTHLEGAQARYRRLLRE